MTSAAFFVAKRDDFFGSLFLLGLPRTLKRGLTSIILLSHGEFNSESASGIASGCPRLLLRMKISAIFFISPETCLGSNAVETASFCLA